MFTRRHEVHELQQSLLQGPVRYRILGYRGECSDIAAHGRYTLYPTAFAIDFGPLITTSPNMSVGQDSTYRCMHIYIYICIVSLSMCTEVNKHVIYIYTHIFLHVYTYAIVCHGLQRWCSVAFNFGGF